MHLSDARLALRGRLAGELERHADVALDGHVGKEARLLDDVADPERRSWVGIALAAWGCR
jgi:hypothetical protein